MNTTNTTPQNSISQRSKARTVLAFLCVLAIAAPLIGWAADPTAMASPADVTTAGATSYLFEVRYSDDGPIVISTIDSRDVRVTGPNAFDVAATFVSQHVARATYSIVPPGGSWDSGDNGTYSLVMQPNQVEDMLGNAVHPGVLGTFNVAVTGPSAPAQLVNISTRLNVQTGENVMIGGFIVTGTAPKKVLLRAIGSSLPLAGKLANPTLELFGPAGPIKSNDNWQDAPEKQEIIDSTIPPGNPLESAIVATLPANSSRYTAIVRGAGSGTGIGLVEAYDLDSAADSKLANISTRGLVQTGDNAMIGGFIITGGTSKKVIVRAIGPSLPVPGKLADPTLELFNASGQRIALNNNWRETQQAEIIASMVPPTSDLESAIVSTLPPGGTTAVVRGNGGTTGVALVEVYSLD